MVNKIQIKRGLKSKLPILADGELGLCTNTNEVFVGNGGTNIDITNKSQLAEIVNGFANLKGNNGYTKLPNGFILQWGSINLTLNKSSWSTSYLDLPIVFPNIGVTGGACATYNDTTGTVYQALGVNAMVQANYSKTQVGVGLCDTGATGSPLATGVNTIGVRWWVLGY